MSVLIRFANYVMDGCGQLYTGRIFPVWLFLTSGNHKCCNVCVPDPEFPQFPQLQLTSWSYDNTCCASLMTLKPLRITTFLRNVKLCGRFSREHSECFANCSHELYNSQWITIKSNTVSNFVLYLGGGTSEILLSHHTH